MHCTYFPQIHDTYFDADRRHAVATTCHGYVSRDGGNLLSGCVTFDQGVRYDQNSYVYSVFNKWEMFTKLTPIISTLMETFKKCLISHLSIDA